MTGKGRRRLDCALRAAVAGCAALCMASVGAISCYLLLSGLPALREIGLIRFLFGGVWAPGDGRYGIFAMLLSSLAACFGALLVSAPLALMGAAFAVAVAPPSISRAVLGLARLLAGLPSVVFGLLGMMVVVPALGRVFPEKTAQNGGATLLAAILVLAAVVLPSMLVSLAHALDEAGGRVRGASDALGALPMQTLFEAQIPAARTQSLGVFGMGAQRALGEAMAVLLVSGNVANMPSLFSSARLLAAGMVLEMGYAVGTHRTALFAMGLMLLGLTLLTGGLLRVFGGRKE